MVDVLLAHSFFLRNDARQLEKMKPYPPLGTLYAASQLRAQGYSVAVFDAMLSDDIGVFVDLLQNSRPKIVAFHEDQFHFLNKMCLGHARDALCRMSELARERGATVIAAGSDPSDHPEIYFRHQVQYVLVGEPDHTLAELINALTGKIPVAPDRIAGLAFPDPAEPSRVRTTAPRHPERFPDVFPVPRLGSPRRRKIPPGLARIPRLFQHQHGLHARLPVPLQLVRETDLGAALRDAFARQCGRRNGLDQTDAEPGSHLVRRRHFRPAAQMGSRIRP